ncbi:TolC family protein [Flavobacterium pectinovorum]|uniref:Outer membrane protein TolC n=2 Tax=Flavobacterium pectinovorum TaxID=29533 RepID=A0ABY1J634_9FLAO|nr:TolC family protein [Flavobacterium pectinovorum]SHM82091.1 Outer membrane protein TolC [Flavobacterium pectinovorum]
MKSIYSISIITMLSLTFCCGLRAQGKQLSLEECRTMALANNKKIKKAAHNIDAAKAGLASTKASALPSLEGSVKGIHVGDPLSSLLPGEMLNGGLDIKQNIYSGGKLNYGKQTASKSVELYEKQKEMTEAEVLLAVETSYWQLVQATENIAVSNKYRDMLKDLRQVFQNSVDAGLTYKNDLLRAEVNLNNAELSILQANDALILGRLNLAQLIGQPGEVNFTIEEALEYNYQEVNGQESVQDRPEIQIMKKSLEIEELQTKILKADQLPQVGLSASGLAVYGNGVNPSNQNNQMYTYYGMLSVSIPIFNWGKNQNIVKEQKFKVEAAKEELEDSKELYNIEMANAQMQLNQSFKKIALSNASLRQSEENLRLANDRYGVGTITGNDVLEAQVIWEQAVLALVRAKAEYMINLASYKKTIGKL